MTSFRLDPRLLIRIPDFQIPFEELSLAEREAVLLEWEIIRAAIPDQIMRFEEQIEQLLQRIHEEEHWDTIAAYFAQISDLASRIHTLNMWRRVDPSLHVDSHPSTM